MDDSKVLELINKLTNEDSEENKQRLQEMIQEVGKLEFLYIGLSDKKVSEDDSKRKPGFFAMEDNRVFMNVFTNYEIAKRWANYYDRKIAKVERGNLIRYDNIFSIARFTPCEYIYINELSDYDVMISLAGFIKFNNLDSKYMVQKDPNINEDGSLHLDFALEDVIEIEDEKDA